MMETHSEIHEIHIGNVPRDAEEQQLIDIFSAVSDRPPQTKMIPFRGSSFTTHAFVTYHKRTEAENAVLSLNGVKLGPQHLVVTISDATRKRCTKLQPDCASNRASWIRYERSKNMGEVLSQKPAAFHHSNGGVRGRESILREKSSRRWLPAPGDEGVRRDDQRSINHILRKNLR